MLRQICVIAFCLSLLTTETQCAKILFYFAVSTYSHRITVWPLVEALAARGHDVTFLSPFAPKKPNPAVTEFVPQALQDYMSEALGSSSDLIALRFTGNHEQLWHKIRETGVGSCEILMKDEGYLKLARESVFDLVIIDALYNDCALGIVHLHKSKYMLYQTTHPFMWQYDAYGFLPETSWISDLAYSLEYPFSYFDRFINTFRPLIWYYTKVWQMYPRLEKCIQEGFRLNGSISLRSMESQIALILMNSHFSLENARALPPLYVPVAGLHVSTKPEPLPKNIRKFVDDSGEEGFVYISFGTGAQISKTSPAIQKIFFDTLAKFKTRFVWKWESDSVPAEMPANVITAKWMPQNDILSHPKLRAFITHGGLLSIQEATTFGVPLILFPFFAEQDFNAERAARIGYGIRMEFKTFNRESLEKALNDILYDSRYKEKMLQISSAFTDRQVPPLETAIWWTEYVLRQNHSLQIPLGIEQSWFLRRSLDIWGLIIGITAFVIGVLCGYKLKKLSGLNVTTRKEKLN